MLLENQQNQVGQVSLEILVFLVALHLLIIQRFLVHPEYQSYQPSRYLQLNQKVLMILEFLKRQFFLEHLEILHFQADQQHH